MKPDEYVNKLVDHSLVKVYAIASVRDTKQTWSEEDDFQLIKPKLSVEVSIFIHKHWHQDKMCRSKWPTDMGYYYLTWRPAFLFSKCTIVTIFAYHPHSLKPVLLGLSKRTRLLYFSPHNFYTICYGRSLSPKSSR